MEIGKDRVLSLEPEPRRWFFESPKTKEKSIDLAGNAIISSVEESAGYIYVTYCLGDSDREYTTTVSIPSGYRFSTYSEEILPGLVSSAYLHVTFHFELDEQE
jgi:hypothetical protein